MGRNEPLSRSSEEYADRRLRLALSHHPEQHPEPRTIVIRQGSGWQLAFLFLCLLFIAVVLLGHYELRGLDAQNHETGVAMARAERKLQQLESGIGYDTQRRQVLLGMRNHIMKVNPKVSLADAYLYARMALDVTEKYPSVDPLLLLAIGTVESGYDPQAKSRADARGLYQIWPSTGRLLARSLGWNYEETTLYDPEKNTEAAALYLDILFSTYNDPQMVLAEYNGGPVNAGYYRADVAALATETRNYVPRVLELYTRLKDQFETGPTLSAQLLNDGKREGKLLGVRSTAVLSRSAPTPAPARASAAPASTPEQTASPAAR